MPQEEHRLPKDLTLIIADAPPLHGIQQRVQQLAREFERAIAPAGGKVWYFDEPGNIVTVFLSPEKPLSNLWSWIEGPHYSKEHENILHFAPPAGLPFGYHNRGINRWNHFWYRAALGPRFRRGSGPVVLIVCNVLGLGWIGKLGEDCVIYDCADEISEFRQARLRKEAVQAQERELLRKADAVVTTSQRLYDSKSPFAKRTVLIRNAADVVSFNRALWLAQKEPRPRDIADLKKPIVGFYGFLADWLDWPLIERVVAEGQEFDWVFIGPSTHDLTALRNLPNFHFLGRKLNHELPGYLAHFACAHIPFAITPLTVNVNPVKLYEYLAAGVPVVATPLPELEAFRDVCRLADNPDDYLRLIREEIASDSFPLHQARAARVASETWQNRLGQYLQLISELLS
jgi:glycosyltransferase involved in cell wall biosynthesis